MVILVCLLLFLMICGCYSKAEKDREEIFANLDQVQKNLDHIKEMMNQDY